MQVILLERVEKLGQMGDVVNVKDGFARNFLLPKKKAMRATKVNLGIFEAQRAQLEADNLKRREEAEKVASSMADLRVTMIRAAGESGQLYGSVSSRDIAEAVSEAGVTINRNQVVLDRAIKTLGLHELTIRLHAEVTQTVIVNIARSVEEAETQFETGSAVVGMDDEDEFEFEPGLDEALEAAEEAAAEAEGETGDEASDEDVNA